MTEGRRVLAVEDSEVKWRDMEEVLTPVLKPGTELVRIADMANARDAIYQQRWDLLLLDVSLDVNPGGGQRRGGQEFTGGLTLASRMRYRRKEIPTIVVTGFTTFLSAKPANEPDLVLGLEDVEREMRKFLGDHIVGFVRYAVDGWRDELIAYVGKALAT